MRWQKHLQNAPGNCEAEGYRAAARAKGDDAKARELGQYGRIGRQPPILTGPCEAEIEKCLERSRSWDGVRGAFGLNFREGFSPVVAAESSSLAVVGQLDDRPSRDPSDMNARRVEGVTAPDHRRPDGHTSNDGRQHGTSYVQIPVGPRLAQSRHRHWQPGNLGRLGPR